ncbi:MAG: hypothetical protein K2G70_06050 [Turicibacter sp.]|nr:hypothetical protein [Turicibacter sp.]
MFWTGFLLGGIGTFSILVVYSCLVMASRADQQMGYKSLEDSDSKSTPKYRPNLMFETSEEFMTSKDIKKEDTPKKKY